MQNDLSRGEKGHYVSGMRLSHLSEAVQRFEADGSARISTAAITKNRRLPGIIGLVPPPALDKISLYLVHLQGMGIAPVP